jgi:hypothetical protein
MEISPAMLIGPVVTPDPTVIVGLIANGSVATVTLLATQLPGLPDVTVTAVTEVKFAVNGFVLCNVNQTVPLWPGNRSAVAVAAATVTLTGLPTPALAVPELVVLK